MNRTVNSVHVAPNSSMRQCDLYSLQGSHLFYLA
nr:MAG TPA: hypothetical protein [Caudoviricetes sp.]DAQ09421.1 MAG TPA: hypothetical protein [Caudoviricetes sp.]